MTRKKLLHHFSVQMNFHRLSQVYAQKMADKTLMHENLYMQIQVCKVKPLARY